MQCGINEAKWESLFLSSLHLHCSLGKELGFWVVAVSGIFDFVNEVITIKLFVGK